MSPRPRCADPEIGERLAAYELGLLRPDERAAVEAHLETCEACREEAWATAPYATMLVGDPAGVRAAIPSRAALAGAAPGETAARPIGSRLLAALRGFGRWLTGPRALAPAAALAALAIVLVLRGGPDDPAALARVEPLPWIPMATRDATADDATGLFRRGMTEYVAHDWRTAAETLRRALAAPDAGPDWAERDRARLFLGLCLLLDGDPEGAIEPLEVATGSSLRVIADRARWFLAQAELKRRRPDAAATHLRALAAGSPGYAAVAAEQLRRVEALGER
jgi:anti-sigma factor RsiW